MITKFLATPMQQNFYIEQIFNENSSKKYNLNLICSVKSNYKVDIKKALLEVINNQKLLLTVPKLIDSKLYMVYLNDFKNEDIKEINGSFKLNELENDYIFTEPFNLMKNKFLFRVKVIKKSTNDYILLMSFHHILLDFYGATNLLQQINDCLNNIELPSNKCLTEQFFYTKDKYLLANEKIKINNFYSKLLENVSDNKLEINNFNDKKITTNLMLNNRMSLYTPLERSSILITAIIDSIKEIKKDFNGVIGVPVPNRNKKNEKLISCLVGTYPVCIQNERSYTDIDKVISIKKLMFKELKNQYFNFQLNFPKYSKFYVTFTFYDSNFIFEGKNSTVKLIKHFTLFPPSPIHIMLDKTNKLIITTMDNSINHNKLVNEIEKRIYKYEVIYNEKQ